MKTSQQNATHINTGLNNTWRTQGVVKELTHTNSTVTDCRNTKIGIAYTRALLTFVIAAILLIGIVFGSGCKQRDTTTYIYRVQYVTSGAKSTAVSIERGTATYGSYEIGDTVHVNRGDTIVTDGRYRKAVITAILPN